MHSMYPSSHEKRRLGIHPACMLPSRHLFAVQTPQIMHGDQILPLPERAASAGRFLPRSMAAVAQILPPTPREGGSCWAILTTLDGYRRANPGAGGFRRTNPNTFKDFHWTNPAARQLPSRESRHAQLLQCGAGCNSLCAKT